MQTAKWPKVLPVLTPEQQLRSDQFMKLWHEVLPNRYGTIEKFNHSFPVKFSKPGFKTTLEVARRSRRAHPPRETLSRAGEKHYANEFRENMAADIRRVFPRVQTGSR